MIGLTGEKDVGRYGAAPAGKVQEDLPHQVNALQRMLVSVSGRRGVPPNHGRRRPIYCPEFA